jgi:hypothetical protein
LRRARSFLQRMPQGECCFVPNTPEIKLKTMDIQGSKRWCMEGKKDNSSKGSSTPEDVTYHRPSL